MAVPVAAGTVDACDVAVPAMPVPGMLMPDTDGEGDAEAVVMPAMPPRRAARTRPGV